ncbi:3'-5' exonuclease [Silvimonas sp.]|uniref:3'-5' exonuclease n=1 Tax=Silvimonas sp. TaxID=2650811 RepID=UPI00284FE5A5|nr:3'-5' exonuclease [Silvimonas sp.]MDR3427787.1 3'-5' exoribonuclease [Silvimonas sp.]
MTANIPANTTHVMVDLETFGTGPDAVIVSLGAVKFSPSEGTIFDSFHVGVDPVSAVMLGGKMDADTLMWWLDEKQDGARKALMGLERLDIASALEGFAQWFGSDSLPVWGNGATFDNVILRRACTNAGMACPWKFWHDRCYRTIKQLAPATKISFTGLTQHSALDDATAQATHLCAIVEALELELA